MHRERERGLGGEATEPPSSFASNFGRLTGVRGVAPQFSYPNPAGRCLTSRTVPSG